MAKITVSFMRELFAQLRREEITFSRMVERINEKVEQVQSVNLELKDGLWIQGASEGVYIPAMVIYGGYASNEGGFWATIKEDNGQAFTGTINDPSVYDSIVDALLAKRKVGVIVPWVAKTPLF